MIHFILQDFIDRKAGECNHILPMTVSGRNHFAFRVR
jgi:hypothetical protein